MFDDFGDFKRQLPDRDADETSDWISSLDSVVQDEGRSRAQFILYRLLKRARQHNLGLPPLTSTRYINTISPEQEPEFPGDEPFSIYTRWIETEYDNGIEPWSGELAETSGPAARAGVVVEVGGRRIEVTLPKRLVGGASADGTAGPAPRRRAAHHAVDTATGDAVKAPMQATVVKVAVAEGDKVVKGDLVLVLEAMKMEQPILAHKDGVVGIVNAEAGATVSSGHLLLAITDAPAA